MKIYTKWLIILLVFALVMPFVLNGPGGRRIMTMDDWLPDTGAVRDNWLRLKQRVVLILGGKTEALLPVEPLGPVIDDTHSHKMTDGKTVYSWRDNDGVWHFSTEAPAPGESAG